MVVIPSTIQVFAWSTTIFTGRPRFTTPLLFIVGFILFFVIGGLTGIMFVAIPFDQQVTDTYFVVAHFHYIIFGAAVFPIFGGMYYWFPKVTGRMYYELPGQISFWIIFVGTNLLFFPMHIVGLLGMPRRVYTYPGGMGWTAYNVLESVGGFVTARRHPAALRRTSSSPTGAARPRGPDPWHGPTLEWTTSSPPPEYNFAVIPTRVERLPELGRRRPRGRPAAPRRRRRGARPRARAGRDDVRRRRAAGDRRDAALLAVADRARALRLRRCSPCSTIEKFTVAAVFAVLAVLTLLGVALEGAAGGVSDFAAPRTTSALDAAAAARARRGRPAAWWGMAMFVAAEAALFGMMIGSYFYLAVQERPLAACGHPGPEGRRAARPARRPRRDEHADAARRRAQAAPGGSAPRGTARRSRSSSRRGTSRCRCTCTADDLCRFAPTDHAYASIYYTLLGADHAHVAVGLLFNVWLLAKLARGLTTYRLNALTRSRSTGTPSTRSRSS